MWFNLKHLQLALAGAIAKQANFSQALPRKIVSRSLSRKDIDECP